MNKQTPQRAGDSSDERDIAAPNVADGAGPDTGTGRRCAIKGSIHEFYRHQALRHHYGSQNER